MNPAPDPFVANALLEAETGTPALDVLMPRVYEELRDIAHRYLAADPDGHTLSTTALIHEAYLRLADTDRVGDRGRAYFFASAARAMRRVLVDYARRRSRVKRGGGAQPLTLDDAVVAGKADPVDVLDLDRALARLDEVSPRAAAVVDCRFFGGLTVEETADALGVTGRTVKRDWAFARAWLLDHLQTEVGGE